jgi:hypothetical protein
MCSQRRASCTGTAPSERVSRRAGCGKSARPDLWGPRRVTGGATRPLVLPRSTMTSPARSDSRGDGLFTEYRNGSRGPLPASSSSTRGTSAVAAEPSPRWYGAGSAMPSTSGCAEGAGVATTAVVGAGAAGDGAVVLDDAPPQPSIRERASRSIRCMRAFNPGPEARAHAKTDLPRDAAPGNQTSTRHGVTRRGAYCAPSWASSKAAISDARSI